MNAVYAGSFDPFTNGHLSIVEQACEIFDVVYIMICENSSKHKSYDSIKMAKAIRKTVKHLPNCIVYNAGGLVIDFARSNNAKFLIRGLRNNGDYNYEENIAKINTSLDSNIKTIYLRADNEIISSSFVKEMYRYDKNIAKQYVSQFVYDVMCGKDEYYR